MAKRRLLSRIASTRGDEYQTELNALLEKLRILFNSRRGCSTSEPEFGLHDFSDLIHAFPDAFPVLRAHIGELIQANETRLSEVFVKEVPSKNPLELHIEIVGWMRDKTSTRKIRVGTRLKQGSRTRLKET